MSDDPADQPSCPPYLLIEHRSLKIWWKKGNNSKMGNGIYFKIAAHFCNLNLTSISYSFWNIRRKVLKFKRSKLFQKSSPLKPLGQFKPNLAWIILRGFPLKLCPMTLPTNHHARAYFCNLNLTFISYSFWNKGRKVLRFSKFD
jgi:hypothetical protein